MKRTTTISVEDDLLTWAQNAGLNVSQLTGDAIVEKLLTQLTFEKLVLVYNRSISQVDTIRDAIKQTQEHLNTISGDLTAYQEKINTLYTFILHKDPATINQIFRTLHKHNLDVDLAWEELKNFGFSREALKSMLGYVVT